jgi:hypothetical protein
MKIKYLIPSIYKSFFTETVWNYSISETKATCNSCIKAPSKYKSDLKCCTFWPFIPNYIVGHILSSKDDKYINAQKLIREHIKKKNYNLPIGLVAPPWYQGSFKKNKSKIFGKSENYLCPYYQKEDKLCGIWLFRGSVCTSFYCESSYGAKGKVFWKSFENYLSYLEMALSEEVLVYNDYSPREMSYQLEYLDITSESKMYTNSKKMNLKEYKKIWKHNYGNEEEFYVKSAEFVNELPKQQISDIKGELGKLIYKNLEEKRAEL